MPISFNEYQAGAMRTARLFNDEVRDLTHAALGLASESGEFAGDVKRLYAYNAPLADEVRAHAIEELGDILWYIALACESLGVSIHQVARENIEKLQRRYPDAYSDAAALARADKGGLSHKES